MRTDRPHAESIDEYIAGFPPDVQQILQKIRTTIRRAAPEAEEVISYQMPTFKLEGNLVHFAAFRSHIGLYPTPSGTERFRKELSSYETGKGSIRFPLDEPIPYDLITKIVRFRVKENRERAKARQERRDSPLNEAGCLSPEPRRQRLPPDSNIQPIVKARRE